jgi:hypothetical protein
MTDPTHLTQPCARVNGAFMRENVGRKVRLVCKQEGISGRTMTVLAADNARLTVNLAEGASYDTEYIEFEGVVDSDTVLTEHSHTNFGNNFGARLLIITPSLPVKHRAAGLKHRRTAWHVDRCVSRSLPCERRRAASDEDSKRWSAGEGIVAQPHHLRCERDMQSPRDNPCCPHHRSSPCQPGGRPIARRSSGGSHSRRRASPSHASEHRVSTCRVHSARDARTSMGVGRASQVGAGETQAPDD